MFRFSVVVPFKNEEKYIKRCVESILSQTFPREQFEILFVENCSEDGSAEIIKNYAEIQLFHESKSNVYAARNFGASKAKGEYLLFTDADCFLESDYLERLNAQIERSGALFLTGDVKFSRKALKTSRILERYEVLKQKFIYENLPPQYHSVYGCHLVIQRAVFESLNGFDECFRVGGDTAFVQKFLENHPQNQFQYDEGLVVHHEEMLKISDWYRKTWKYQYDNCKVRKSTRFRFLSNQHRWTVLSQVNKMVSTKEYLVLTFHLAVGYLVYLVVRLASIFSKKAEGE